MSSFAEIQERAEELAKELRNAGMNGVPYKRAPIATEVASLSLEGGGTGVRVWPGEAKVTVIPDRKRKQAVVRLKEGAREITRTYTVRGKWYDSTEMPEKQQRQDARNNFPVFVPKMTFKEITLGSFNKGSKDRNVTATALAPATSQTFLVGIDESSHFISPLKHHVSSVEAAHTLLRPSGVPKDALRQGEWFFVPVTPKELAAINTRLENSRHDSWNGPGVSGYVVQPLEEGSTHRAPVCRVGKQLYACGAVRDMRLRRHSPLILNGWYRVVRNTELINPVQQQMNQRFNYD